MKPYYSDDSVTLYHGDCREVSDWLAADVLLTDPPYGIAWKQGALKRSHSDAHSGIANDATTEVRDAALRLWGDKRAAVFGSFALAPPTGTKQTLVYRKPPNAGTRGAIAGFRRDAEAIYLLGAWPAGLGGRSSIVATTERTQGNPSSPQGRFDHPHAKPVDVLSRLLECCSPVDVIADPFAGSGSSLVAAKLLGFRSIGVELIESYCETAARRLSQEVLDLSPTETIGR